MITAEGSGSNGAFLTTGAPQFTFSLAEKRLSRDGRTFQDLYRWLWARVEALDAADVTGAYSVAAADPEKRRAALAEIRALDVQIADLRRQAKGNLPLAEKIALNVKIKALQRAREAAKEGLA